MTIEACKKLVAAMLALAWLVVACAVVFGQDIKLDGNVEVVKVDKVVIVKEDRTLVKSLPLKLIAPQGGLLYRWRWPAGVKAVELSNVLEITEAPKGELSFSVQWAVIDFEKKLVAEKAAQVSFYVGEVRPPDPPKPPGPEPTPAPTGFRVLFIHETAQALSPTVSIIFNSTAIKRYLDEKCVKDGAQPSWRRWDKDTDLEHAPASLRQLADQTRSKWTMPCVVVAADNVAQVYPIPPDYDEDAMLAFLKKYGG